MAVAAIAVAVAVAALSDAAGRATRITVMDVGQGDAILLETRTGARMLIDGGPDPDRILLALDARIPPWDRRLDVVVLTHPHEDHVAGLARVLARYSVGRVYEPGMRGPGPGWTQWNAELRDGPPRAGLQTGRPAPSRRGPAQRPLARPWHRAARAARHRHRDQQRVDRVPRRGRRAPLPADGRRRAGHRPDAPRPRPSPRRPPQGRPPRERDGVDPAVRGRRQAEGRHRVRRGGQPVRAPREVDAGPAACQRRPRLPDGPGRLGRGGAPRGRPLGPRDRRPPGAATTVAVPATAFLCAIPVPRGSPAWVAAPRTPAAPPVAQSWNLAETTGRASAWAEPTGYDPLHDDPRSPRSRPPAGVPASVGQVHPARLRGRRHRGLPRVSGEPGGTGHQPAPGRDGRAAPRRRQAGHGAGARPPPARRGVGGLARGAWLPGARARGPGPPGDPARGSRLRGVGEHREPRGADRRLRGQAGGSAPRADGRAVRALEAEVPARVGRGRAPERQRRLERGGVRAGGAPCAGPGARGLRSRGVDPGDVDRLRWSRRALRETSV